ncbi:MAG: Transcriptional regulator CopG/Arc/MetJ family [Candidatus Methanohalarchaeum thermophilum]|uniref:Transcriptional regulator CopG/Arc/MetJ family n=1 Tax=Methanohalarchaeum thermophilum TaxID=1903181 RepID=A0A1Q6DSY9_METT1|nr:MAG: Transcriptional regulator CopG/Arc/MetJ family [Candidatus Methanohalarchaeum thermophilum]
MGRKEYTTIKLPKKVADKIDKYIEENPAEGFSSRTELIKDALREYFHEREKFKDTMKFKDTGDETKVIEKGEGYEIRKTEDGIEFRPEKE